MPITAEPETKQDHPRGVKPRMQYPRQPPPLFTYATLLWQSHYSLSPFQSRLSVQPPEAKQEVYSVYTVPGIALGRPAWHRSRSSRRRAGTRPFLRNETPWTGAAGAQPTCGSATLHAGDTPCPWGVGPPPPEDRGGEPEDGKAPEATPRANVRPGDGVR